MNGVARNPFTTAASARCRVGARIRPPGAASTRNTASGIPSATAMATDAPTMVSVSRKAAQSRSTICGDITEYPCPIGDARELTARPAGARPDRPPTAARTRGPECGRNELCNEPEGSAERLSYGQRVRLKTALADVGQLDQCAARARRRLRLEPLGNVRRNVAIKGLEERARRWMCRIAEHRAKPARLPRSVLRQARQPGRRFRE